jgi:hypothetical protein
MSYEVSKQIMAISEGQRYARGVFDIVDKLGFIPIYLKQADCDSHLILKYVEKMVDEQFHVRKDMIDFLMKLGLYNE